MSINIKQDNWQLRSVYRLTLQYWVYAIGEKYKKRVGLSQQIESERLLTLKRWSNPDKHIYIAQIDMMISIGNTGTRIMEKAEGDTNMVW